MKRFLMLLTLCTLVAVSAFGAPTQCPAGALTPYLVGGFSCVTNTSTSMILFSNFLLTQSGNAASGGAAGITVAPISTPGNEGFLFNPAMGVSGSGNTWDDLISYAACVTTDRMTCSGQTGISNLELSFNGSFTGTGSTNVTEHYCFSPTTTPVGTCSTPPGGGQIQVTNPPPSFNAQVFFSAQSAVAVSKDIFATSGSNGTANISSVINQFSTPEPLSLVLLGSGLLGLGMLRRRVRKG